MIKTEREDGLIRFTFMKKGNTSLLDVMRITLFAVYHFSLAIVAKTRTF